MKVRWHFRTSWKISTRWPVRTCSTDRTLCSGSISGRRIKMRLRPCTRNSGPKGYYPMRTRRDVLKSIRRSGQRRFLMRMPILNIYSRSSRTTALLISPCCRAPRQSSASGGSTTGTGIWTASTTPGMLCRMSSQSGVTPRLISL